MATMSATTHERGSPVLTVGPFFHSPHFLWWRLLLLFRFAWRSTEDELVIGRHLRRNQTVKIKTTVAKVGKLEKKKIEHGSIRMKFKKKM
jgi:hypothetical protein